MCRIQGQRDSWLLPGGQANRPRAPRRARSRCPGSRGLSLGSLPINSISPEHLTNNVFALARTAKVLNVPTMLTTVNGKSGPLKDPLFQGRTALYNMAVVPLDFLTGFMIGMRTIDHNLLRRNAVTFARSSPRRSTCLEPPEGGRERIPRAGRTRRRVPVLRTGSLPRARRGNPPGSLRRRKAA